MKQVTIKTAQKSEPKDKRCACGEKDKQGNSRWANYCQWCQSQNTELRKRLHGGN
jgi:hypothetical protein